MSEQESNVPELPEKQPRRGESYSPEVMDHYARKFGLTADDLKIQKWRWLIKSKIDTDVFVTQQNAQIAEQGEEIARLKLKVNGLLRIIGRTIPRTKPKVSR
jgi:hypothetical protein